MEWELPNELDTGCLPSPTKIGPQRSCSHPACRTYEVKPRSVQQGSNTGSCLRSIPSRSDSLPLSPALSDRHTANQPDQKPPMTMFGRKTPRWTEQDLKWVNDLTEEMSKPTGSEYGNPLLQGTFCPSKQVFVFNITAHSVQYALTTLNQLLLNVESLSFMDLQVLENREEPGKKPVGLLILKIREANFGMDTQIRRMLYLMNFEEESIFPIYCDGLIATQYSLKSRELQRVW
ncbi:hypothetical protein [Circovirus-like genome DCCV-13]|uniref:Uncharacterized protein n=1 Tax=Circovirus-like genome DCCV-13 TaxID=1788441 RepID=A0A190WHC9_9VIRU|nr:hypothetical protein [Circovirus-like genome DCCV-13]AMB42992.1 hypothetical protein [Circovirus-like genome DCCV-13]